MAYQAIFRQIGNTLDLPSTTPLKQGQIVRLGSLTGVIVRELTQLDIDAGRKAAWRIDGVWRLPKPTGTAVTGCVPIWWDDTAEEIVLAAGGSAVPFGYADPAGATADATTVDVLLVPGATLA